MKESDKEKKPKTLGDLAGYPKSSVYKTSDIDEYSSMLEKMSLSDMQNHAINVGLAPSSERNHLQKTLIREFRSKVSASFGGTSQDQPIDPNKKEAALKIMSRGR